MTEKRSQINQKEKSEMNKKRETTNYPIQLQIKQNNNNSNKQIH